MHGYVSQKELSTVAYTQRAYKRDVQIMMKEPSEGTTPQPSGEFASSKDLFGTMAGRGRGGFRLFWGLAMLRAF
ncbi:unnamed protein product [Symbiodinium sp. CCMP2592]|nr:unnamed protein product [Symbiodinium sp. CCMP2592]